MTTIPPLPPTPPQPINQESRPLSEDAGVTFNLRNQVEAQNEQTGSRIDVDKQVAANNAVTVVNLLA